MKQLLTTPLRLKRGQLSQLAKALNLSRTHVGRMASGERPFTPERLTLVTDYLVKEARKNPNTIDAQALIDRIRAEEAFAKEGPRR